MIARLDALLLERWDRVQGWFEDHIKRLDIPIYTSVDLRNARYKLAAIDTNIYPAGFNNLCTIYNQECVISFKQYLESKYGDVKKILLIAEANTRNRYYVENIKSIILMLEKDGYEVKPGLVSADMWKDSIEVEGTQGPLTLHKIIRDSDTLIIKDFVPDLVINNNDFSDGIPDIIKGIKQPIDPPPELGWELRRKSHHFEILERLMIEFSRILELDHWLLHACTSVVQGVDFRTMEGIDRIAHAIDDIIEKLHKKHAQHGVSETPFVFVKSNYGTYGLAVTTAKSGEDFLAKMKKEKKKMQKGKGGVAVTEVIVQEGIPTADIHDDCPVEPVIYVIGGNPMGGFYRINCERTVRENLNTRGMTFSKICFHQLENRKPAFLDEAACSDIVMMRVWGTLARIAALAAAYEQVSIKK